MWRKKLQYSQVIQRVINSVRRIDLEKFQAYLKKAYLHHLKNFNYAPIVDTVHRDWGHCISLMEELLGFALGFISESPLECTHHDLRWEF